VSAHAPASNAQQITQAATEAIADGANPIHASAIRGVYLAMAEHARRKGISATDFIPCIKRLTDQAVEGHLPAWENMRDLIGKLVTVAGATNQLTTWEEWERFLSGVAEGLGEAIKPYAAREPRQIAPVIRDGAIESRDQWIYEQCCKGIPYDTIAIQLKKKPKSWPRLYSKQGVRTAAIRYASRQGLPPIPRRQDL